MNKKIIRILAGILMGVLMLTMLCGCTKDTDTVPYMEKLAVSYEDKTEFELPFIFTFVESSDVRVTTEYAGYSFEYDNAKYTVTDVKTTETEDGYIDVEVTLDVNFKVDVYEGSDIEERTGFNANYLIADFQVVDYYTGTILPRNELNEDSTFADSTDIKWQKKKYDIGYSLDRQWSTSGWGDWQESKKEGQAYEIELNKGYTVVHRFHFAKDYDGIVFVIEKKGISEYKLDSETTEEENAVKKFLSEDKEETTSADDYYYFKLSDLIAKFAK